MLSALPAPPHWIVTPPFYNSNFDVVVEKTGPLLALSTDKTRPILACADPGDTNVVCLTLRMPSILWPHVAFTGLSQ